MALHPAATLLTGATVWWGDPPSPRPTWVLVENGHIAAVGQPGQPPPAAGSVIDVAGRHLTPAFIDAHAHLSAITWLPVSLDGEPWKGVDDAVRQVRDAARHTAAGSWIVAMGHDASYWRGSLSPIRHDLDAAAPGRPVLLIDVTRHCGVLSSEGLRACGIGQWTPDPHGDIERAAHGEPNGVVWEQALGRAEFTALRGLAEMAAETGVDDLLDRAAERCLSLGIARVHDPGVAPDVDERLRRLARRTPLRLSWSACSPDGLLEPPPPPDRLPGGPYGAGELSVKLFLDGAQRCALCLPPRALLVTAAASFAASLRRRDIGPLRLAAGLRLKRHGLVFHTDYLRFRDGTLRAVIAAHAKAGARLRLHALGGLAVEQAARVLSEVRPSQLPVVEHAMLISRREADALVEAQATVCLQPGFLPHYGPLIRDTGQHRLHGVIASRMLVDSGVRVAFGSDAPCGPLDPLHNLRRAVTRRTGAAVLQPEQALTRSDALRAATAGAAAALGAPPPTGTILPGAPADLAVLDGDPFNDGTTVVQTWVAGEPVWRRNHHSVVSF